MKYLAAAALVLGLGHLYVSYTLEQRIQQHMQDIDRAKCQRIEQQCLKLDEGMCYFMKQMNGCSD